MLLSLLSFDIPWLDLVCLAAAITLLEGAITGRGTTHGRGRSHQWPVVAWLRPIFAIVGFILFAFGLTDLFRRLSK
jgi:hypothetical protein